MDFKENGVQTPEKVLNGAKFLHAMPPSNQIVVKPQPLTVSLRSKILYTTAIYLVYFVFGLADLIVPTAMDELVLLTHSDVASFSATVMVSLTVSYCLAALAGGWLCNYVNRQVYLIASLLISVVAKVWLPFTSSILQAAICQSLAGIGGAGLDVALNAWLLAIWREKSGSLMLALHFCYAVGTSLSPILTEPFLSNKNSSIISAPNQTFNSSDFGRGVKEFSASDSQIQIPLWIAGALYAMLIVLLIIFHFVSPYNEKNEKLQEQEEKDLDTSSFSPRLSKLILAIASLILMFDVGTEISTFDYNTVFVVRNGFDQHKAAFISSVKSISFTVSRAVAAIAALKVPVRIILYISIIINTIGNFMLLYSTSLPTQSPVINEELLAKEMATKEMMIWLGFAFIGFGFGPLYPAVLSYVQNFIKLTTFICGLFVFIGAWSSILNFLVVGKFIEQYVNVLTYFNLISITGVAVLFVILDLIVRKTTIFNYNIKRKI